jgi:DNA primase
MVIRFLKQLSAPRINLMFDLDKPGQEGAKEALSLFAEKKVDVKLAWSKLDDKRSKVTQAE